MCAIHIYNRPSRSLRFTSFVLIAAFAHLKTGGDCSHQTEDNAWEIGKNNRPVATLFEKTISNPHRAVDKCNERLNPVSLMSGQISNDLWNIGNVHTNGQTRGNHADDAHLVLCSLFAKMHNFLFQSIYLVFCFFHSKSSCSNAIPRAVRNNSKNRANNFISRSITVSGSFIILLTSIYNS